MTIAHNYAQRFRMMYVYGSIGMLVLIMSVTFIDLAAEVGGDLAGRIVAGLIGGLLFLVMFGATCVYCMNILMNERRYEPPDAYDDPDSYQPPKETVEVPTAPPTTLDDFTREYGRSRNGPDYPV